MNTITCPNCHIEFELNNALTQDIEERIKKEHQEELTLLRKKANEVDDLIAQQKEELQTATHKVKIEMAEKLSKEKELLFSQIEDLKKSQASSEDEKRLAIEKAAESAREEAVNEAKVLTTKLIAQAKEEALLLSKNEVNKIELQLKMAEANVNHQKDNFKEMLEQQTKQLDESKKQQKEFFDN